MYVLIHSKEVGVDNMGIFSAISSASKGVLADQWREFYICDAIDNDILMRHGYPKISANSSNTKRNRDVITDGSIICLADGQAAIVVENGQIIETMTEPGEYEFHSELSKSIFSGASMLDLGKETLHRAAFGGDIPTVVQRVLYFNTKEIMGVSFSTDQTIPVRILDDVTGLDMDASFYVGGAFSFRLVDPAKYYSQIADISGMAYVHDVETWMQTMLMTKLYARIHDVFENGIRPSEYGNIGPVLGEMLAEELNEEMLQRGFAICSVVFSKMGFIGSDMAIVQKLQHDKVYVDTNYAPEKLYMTDANKMRMYAAGIEHTEDYMSVLGSGQSPIAKYFEKSAENPSKSNIAQYFKPKDGSWTCNCNTINKGQFCTNCGNKKPLLI